MKLKTSFDFDSAHRLVDYEGKCKNVHGHQWRVELEIEGAESQLDEVGMLMDFTITKELKNMFDHKLILKNCTENNPIIIATRDICCDTSVYLMKENPTAEYLALEILDILKEKAPTLKYLVRVFESPKSSAEVIE